ncbi:MAG: cytochrome [Propionibacteriales bacterium]|nr:MAG: cytochrome [Propionibacteriales bacterium]
MANRASKRRASRPDDLREPRIDHVDGVWRIRGYDSAKQVLAARTSTTQAGFTAEHLPRVFVGDKPVLFSDGPEHDAQRKSVGRFFAPKVVSDRYTEIMHDSAEKWLNRTDSGRLMLDELALHYAVDVTREVVGLTESSVEGMSIRLEKFFDQPPFDITKPDLGRSNRDWAQAAYKGIMPIVRFWWSDVRPAIKKRRQNPQEDVVSHLIKQGHSNREILVECVTYGTAGMVTTREFISMATWHLLHEDDLRARYLVAEQKERLAILAEIIRLEPVVGHLYRRTQEDVVITDGEDDWTIPPGELIDLCIRPANADDTVVGDEPENLCPGRSLPRGVDSAGLSFGHGSHKCPGQPLALLETDVLLRVLLSRQPKIITEPKIGWDDLVAGYTVRGFEIQLDD